MSNLYDYQTEDFVLGAIIRYKEEYDKVSRYFIDLNVFGQDRARVLWKKVTHMTRNGDFIDMNTVCASLSKKDVDEGCTSYYISTCYSLAPTNGTAEYYATKVYEKFLLRRVAKQSALVNEKAKGNNSDVYDVITDAHSLFGELLNIKPSNAANINDPLSAFKSEPVPRIFIPLLTKSTSVPLAYVTASSATALL